MRFQEIGKKEQERGREGGRERERERVAEIYVYIYIYMVYMFVYLLCMICRAQEWAYILPKCQRPFFYIE